MKKILLTLLSIFVAGAATVHAHFLWSTLDPATKTFRIAFQENPGDEPLSIGPIWNEVSAWSPSKSKLQLAKKGDVWQADCADRVATASLDYGVIDRTSSGRGVFWLQYFAKAAATMKDAGIATKLPFDVTAKPVEGGVQLTAKLNGRPVAGAEVVLAGPDADSAKPLLTDAAGTVFLPSGKESLAARVMMLDKAPGAHEGKSYETKRTYYTLTVGKFNAAPTNLPLTKQISRAFGDRHEVVQKTAFVSTLWAGKLTKAQLFDHLEQRAIVHQVLDHILKKSAPLPQFGADQQEVTILLKSDMNAIGDPWPNLSKAWPLTAEMVKAIQESAKSGPYFALGVFHVYYGGITHGGRDIAGEIDRYLGIKLSYYLESDCYSAYAKQVDLITDPAARAEMIRGGLAAYKYIIDVNNADEFGLKG